MTTVALATAMPINPAASSIASGKHLRVVFGNNSSGDQFFRRAQALQKSVVDPNNIKTSFPDLKLGGEFSVWTPLNTNTPLKWHQKVVLAPIAFYHFMTRHNPWWGKKFSEGHVSCVFASPQNPQHQMSCSEYTAMAIKVMGEKDGLWGTIKGCAYGFSRIMRCNPLNLWRLMKEGHPSLDPVWK